MLNSWRQARRNKKSVIKKFGYFPKVGESIETCDLKVNIITEIEQDNDTVHFENGSCSLIHCCDTLDHKMCAMELLENWDTQKLIQFYIG